MFASATRFSSTDYVAAGRIRNRMATHCRAVFARCDVLVSPTVPISPPRLAHEGCVSHMAVVGQTMKYVQLGNFLGLPAVTVPCGLDSAGLPVGCAACCCISFCCFDLCCSALGSVLVLVCAFYVVLICTCLNRCVFVYCLLGLSTSCSCLGCS